MVEECLFLAKQSVKQDTIQAKVLVVVEVYALDEEDFLQVLYGLRESIRIIL